MPTFNVTAEDILVKITDHPRAQGRMAVGMVVAMDEQQFHEFSRFIRTQGSAPTLRLGFGADSTAQAHAAELAAKEMGMIDKVAAGEAVDEHHAAFLTRIGQPAKRTPSTAN